MMAISKFESPTSIAPLVYFRLAFGLLMFISLIRFYLNGWIDDLYICPQMLFPFYGFEWIPRFSPEGIYAVFTIATLSSLMIMAGLLYRLAAVAFFLTFSYLELLDVSNYLNHYYFISLASLLLIILPVGRTLSIDGFLSKRRILTLVPCWQVSILKILIGGLYFMAGLAKLNHDWMIESLPMRIWLPPHSSLPIIGPIMDEPWTAYLFSWAGAIYDLSIPFFLAKNSTRVLALCSVLIFHSLTAILFPIGMFPYIMMASSLVFLPSQTLERILTLNHYHSSFEIKDPKSIFKYNRSKSILAKSVSGIVLFFLFLFPLRFLAYPGNLFWHEQGYRFSWRVMLMEKTGQCFFYVKDPEMDGELEVDNSNYLTPNQEKQMSTQPDMILHFAHYLDSVFREKGVSDPMVRVESWVTLNGRGSQLFVDPYIDLSTIHDGWSNKEWILPLDSIVTVREFKSRNDSR